MLTETDARPRPLPTIDAVVVHAALIDARLFVDEFLTHLDPTRTDWDCEAWSYVAQALEIDGTEWERLWPLYDACLAMATHRMANWSPDTEAREIDCVALAQASAAEWVRYRDVHAQLDTLTARDLMLEAWHGLDPYEHDLDDEHEDLFVTAGAAAALWLADARLGFWHGYWCAASMLHTEARRALEADPGTEAFRTGWRLGVARGKDAETRALIETCAADAMAPRAIVTLAARYRTAEDDLCALIAADPVLARHQLALMARIEPETTTAPQGTDAQTTAP